MKEGKPQQHRPFVTPFATGDELTAFIDQHEAVRPDGKRGVGPPA